MIKVLVIFWFSNKDLPLNRSIILLPIGGGPEAREFLCPPPPGGGGFGACGDRTLSQTGHCRRTFHQSQAHPGTGRQSTCSDAHTKKQCTVLNAWTD
jgi:hypothetical protein